MIVRAQAARRWLAMGVMACAAALAQQPPSRPPPTDPAAPTVDAPDGAAPGAATPGASAPGAAGTPDDEFIEFLGADDVGDAALWAFLKKSAQRKDSTSKPPPQDAKQ